MKDRLYLIEEYDEDEDEEGELINPLQGRRIFVLSLQSDTLQVYTHPNDGQTFNGQQNHGLSGGLCCFDGKLLALVRSRASGRCEDVVALCGV